MWANSRQGDIEHTCERLKITLYEVLIFFLQDSDGQGCPFCRTEIKGTEQVVVDPFSSSHSTSRSESFKAPNTPNPSAHEEQDDSDVRISSETPYTY